MAKTLDDDTRQAVALFRYGLIADLVHRPPGSPGTGKRLRAVVDAARERDLPAEVHLPPSTVHRLLAREGLLEKRSGEPVADRRRFQYRSPCPL